MPNEDEPVDLGQLEDTVKQVREQLKTDSPPEAPQENPNPLMQFPPEVVEAFEGLTWLGYLEDHFELFGHTFSIRTLRGEEELLAAQVCKEWGNTLGQAKAWVWAQIALALMSVDGDPNWCPAIGPDPKAHARAKFSQITNNWYWATAEYIYGRYTELIVRQAEVFEALENL